MNTLAVRARSEQLEGSWLSVVDGDAMLDVDLAPYDTRGVAAAAAAAAPATGWIRTFGVDGPKRVANGPFAHNAALRSGKSGDKRRRGLSAQKHKRPA